MYKCSEGRGHRFKSYRVRQFAFLQKILIFTLALSLPFIAQASENPTIASTSLCGDSYLLALAPGHISALSWQSRSPLSRANAEQRELPQLWDNPEALLKVDADIILFGSGEGKIGDKLDAQSVTLKWGEDFLALKTNAEAINDALGLPSDISDDWAQRIEMLSRRATQRATKPKILYLSRSGGSAGKGTLVDSAITTAGGENVAHSSGWFTPDPEEIITYEPDLIITSYFKNGYESIQATAMRNKIVQRFIARHPNIEIDGNLWPCAGPGLIEAAELIADAIDKLP